jgi:RimJ/RimL family protein N-acetyltransferase
MSTVTLRDVTPPDLPFLFEHQRDPEAVRMAAFPSRDLPAFLAHWEEILTDPTVTTKVILNGDRVAGNVLSFERSGDCLVGYWLGREFWGLGIATRALRQFLAVETRRPLLAHVARHNLGSIRVLEKCGFIRSGEDRVPGTAGAEPVLEFVYTLAP